MASASFLDDADVDDRENEPLLEILRRIGIVAAIVEKFRENLITIDQVTHLSEKDFEHLGVTAIGMRIKIRQAVEDFKRAHGCAATSPSVTKFIELENKKKNGKCRTTKHLTKKKSTRRVRVGWKHRTSIGKYKVMTLKEGGGQQIVDMDKDDRLSEALRQILDIFFPNGQSLLYNLSDVTYHLATFTNEKINNQDTLTVGQYFQCVRSHPVRWYLHTEIKSDENIVEVSQEQTSSIDLNRKNQTTPCASVPKGAEPTDMEIIEADTGDTTVIEPGCSQNATEESTEEDSGTPTIVFRRRRPMFVRKQRNSQSTDVYRSYLDLISQQTIVVSSSSDEDEEIKRVDPTPAEREARDVKLYEILNGIKTNVDSNSTKFNVTRTNPLEGARRAIHRKEFDPANHISVKFADDYGQAEGAIDAGGPMRELFRLVLKELKDSIALTGEDSTKIISLNAKAVREGLYGDMGVLMSMAIVHGGQWPSFFSPICYQSFAVGPEQAHPSIEDIPDLEVRQEIQKMAKLR